MNYILKGIIGDLKFLGDIEKDAYNLLIKHNRLRVAEHSLRVAKKAKIIANQYGINEDMAEAAGLLHDIGGVYANEKRVEIVKSLGLTVLPEEEKLPLILHQKISEVMAKEIFNIHDKEVLSAVGCHTTLKAKASLLDMIVFVADKIEWDQDGLPPYIDEVERALSTSIELAVFTYIKYLLDDRKNLKVVHPWLIDAYEELGSQCMQNDKVMLERANEDNVDILIEWTLDPLAQGPYKSVPNMTKEQLKELFLNESTRHYSLIKDRMNKPIGRFYYRAWNFNKKNEKIDWELNIFIANPEERGKGYGTAAQLLVVDYLKGLPQTNSIFAYTMIDNQAEKKSLGKCGFKLVGNLPNEYYAVDLDNLSPESFMLFVINASKDSEGNV